MPALDLPRSMPTIISAAAAINELDPRRAERGPPWSRPPPRPAAIGGALLLQMIIADETDAAAIAKWEHYKAGTDLGEALAWRDACKPRTTRARTSYGQPNRRRTLGVANLPTDQGRVRRLLHASVAGMLDELAAVPGVRGVMLTFDDFIIGMEQFGTRILPLLHCRGDVRRAA